MVAKMRFAIMSALIMFCLNGRAQTEADEKITISGTVKLESPLTAEIISVFLMDATLKGLIKTEIPESNGAFKFEDISKGNYIVKVEISGKIKYQGEQFEALNNVDLGVLAIPSETNELKEVVVKAGAKPFVERKLDKIIVNVENSIVAAGSTVLEVLERSPGVMVNQESSINLKGKSGVIVLIDGKQTPLSGTDLITYLKGVPAANIESIEIITNPSARYDASGNAGIINIKFKKDQKQGLNGLLSLSYGQGFYQKPSVSGNFNYRKKKWNFFGSHSYSTPKNLTYFFINRKFFDQNHELTSTFEQTSFTKQPIISNNSRFGIDFYATDKTVIGALVNTNWNNNQRDGHTNALITNPDGSVDYTTKTNILLDEDRFNGFANLNFKHTFNNAGKELTADVDFGQFDARTIQAIENKNFEPDGTLGNENKLATNQTGNIKVKSIKADYAHPLSEKAKLETGVKSSLVTTDNDVKFYNVVNSQNELDPAKSNHFIYDENINAAYASYSKEFVKWDFQCGLRIEHTHTKGRQITTDESFSKNYTDIFPNVVVNRKFSEINALSLSYSKRIDRPTYRQLNPFKVFVDSYTYVVGDPTLNSVITHVFELNHAFKGQYITTLSYSKSKESITDIFVQDDDTRISYQIPANIQDYEQFNLGIYVPFKIKKIVNSTLSASVYLNKYSSPLDGGNLQQEFTSWDMNMNNNIVLGKGWTAEVSGFYQSRMVWGLFYIKNLAQVSAGIQKTSPDRNSTFKLSVSDIFQTNHIAVDVRYQNQDFFTNRTWDSRVVTLSYTYRFGKNTVPKARQRTSGVEDEKRRAG
jgi:iron complex outermembrane receptor protein